MRFAVMGSCVSGLTGVFLRERGWKLVNTYHLFSSVHFRRHFVDGAPLPGIDEVRAMLDFPPGRELSGAISLSDNFPATAGDHQDEKPVDKALVARLETEEVDVILCDPWHEPNRHYTVLRDQPADPTYGLILDLDLFRPEHRERYEYRTHASMPRMADDWLAILAWLRARQPKARIFFLCGHYVTSWHVPHRARLHRDLFLALRDRVSDPLVSIIPPLELGESMLKLPDEAHYQMDVYRGLAGHISIACMANWPDWSRGYVLPDRIAQL